MKTNHCLTISLSALILIKKKEILLIFNLLIFSLKKQLTKGLFKPAFPNFFWFAASSPSTVVFDGTPRWLNRSKDQEFVIIGGTLGISSWHTLVENHWFKPNFSKLKKLSWKLKLKLREHFSYFLQHIRKSKFLAHNFLLIVYLLLSYYFDINYEFVVQNSWRLKLKIQLKSSFLQSFLSWMPFLILKFDNGD